ncbi:MAG: hypothetical protein ACXWUG_04760 [Polyangiales bacterium]
MRVSPRVVAILAASLILSSCKVRGSAKGARLVGERVPAALATIAKVDPAQVKFKVLDEPARGIWFVSAETPKDQHWVCFFDRDTQWCDHGEGTIFASLVAYRRLGDNRGSVDDPTWILLLREAYQWASVYPDKDFLVPNDEWKKKLHIPHVERPKDGGVEIDVDVIETSGVTATYHFSVHGEGEVSVKRAPIL